MATTPYATSADVVAYLPAANPAPTDATEIARLIARACDAVDAALVGVTYDTDTNGNPTDAVLVAPALKQAVCAQIAWWVNGPQDELQELAQYQSTTVEGATLNRGVLRAPKLAPQAKDALRVAGLWAPLYPIHLP